MVDDIAKAHLHGKLRAVREALIWKLDGVSEYDARRPLTSTGTNLLGLVKHNAVSDARYFGDVFDRPFPEPMPRWDDWDAWGTDHWATEHETRADVVDLYRRAWAHADATIDELALDACGYLTRLGTLDTQTSCGKASTPRSESTPTARRCMAATASTGPPDAD